ncbi:MAG: response regulator [Oscillospiraceae bacterium]|nr:response regulator [Oscillospiraceae bacterium]
MSEPSGEVCIIDVIRVLVVEDNLSTRLLLRDFLDQLDGVEVCGEAADGQEALALIQAHAPDLITLDLIMPHISGHGLLLALREHPPPKRPKILVISHAGSDQVVEETLTLGADFYLLKPVNLAEVAHSIYMLCQKKPSNPRPLLGKILWLLEQMEVPCDLIGCRGAALAAEALCKVGCGEMYLKEAYLTATKELHTSPENVEKNIRDYIEKLHKKGSPAYQRLMGGMPDRRPKNSAFLTKLTNAVRSDL